MEATGIEAQRLKSKYFAPFLQRRCFLNQFCQSKARVDVEDARRVTEHLVKTGAEPGIWEPWLLVEYPRIAS
jgi:hypothetical protein